MHELKQLVDHSLEEFPVCSKEAWVLSHHIHDIWGNDCLVVFATLLFTQAKQIFDDSHQESLLIFLMHCPTDWPNGPTQLKTEALRSAFFSQQWLPLAIILRSIWWATPHHYAGLYKLGPVVPLLCHPSVEQFPATRPPKSGTMHHTSV